ncbi:thioredoxin domain-containing protein [Haloterrigena sp. SYSU A121-1]|uniref:Thioredoxin domain-containing protein n=1 Tax=Haloterrigena gelatinilytica TaxID=2741724 RepID=A0A8J8GKY8_9EURY|nr:thioredoxin domain-containing protein [Haloterrigena gelatinilytica]NUB91125.1 thioredoxin domain-containing protein [Haloterrigena gelatinilytica]
MIAVILAIFLIAPPLPDLPGGGPVDGSGEPNSTESIQKPNDTESSQQDWVQPANTSGETLTWENRPRIGNDTAEIKIHYFADFRCPYCRSWSKNAYPKLYEEYIEPATIQVVHREAPVLVRGDSDQYRGESGEMALLSQCVWQTEPGKYREWWKSALESTADDVEMLKRETEVEMICDRYQLKERIRQDMAEAKQFDIRGVPFFIIHDTVSNETMTIRGSQPWPVYRDVLETMRE